MTLEKLVVIITAETKQLEKAIDRVKSQLSTLEGKANSVGKQMTKSFSKSASGFGKITKRLGLLGLTAGFITLGKQAIESASDLQEWQNVVDVAFGDAVDQVNQFGKIAIKQFGLSELAAKKLAGNFMAMADGIGLSNEAGAKMAIQLSGLAADMASFFNTTTDATQVALQGIFTNQTRALKQYGVVMTEANLEAFRMARGIQTAYSQMSEAQRVALRYNYVLQATANAHNDYARTAMTWANQMRLLSNNWKQLITSVGNGLVQLLTPVVAILNKILTLAIAVINAIAKVFGGKGISGVSSGGGASPIGGLADDAGDLADNMGDATGAAKKFKATIAGFDELETLNPQPSSGGGGAGGGGAGGVDVGDLDSYFDFMEEDGLLGKFEEFMKRLKELMDAGDWEGVGKEIAGVLNKLMYWLDEWILKFDAWGTKWATITARILNGVVEAFDWEFFGKLISDGLNSIIHICNAFLETFNALALGEGIGRAVNSWFNNIDWTGIGHFFANNLNFFIDIAAGFFDKFIQQAYENGQKLGEAFNAWNDWLHWENLSRAIWEGLNSVAKTIQGFVDMVNWEELKTNVSNALQNIFDNLDMEGIKTAVSSLVTHIMDFLKSVDWYQIGHTVGEMLSAVDWLGVLKDLKDNVIWPAFKGFWDGLMSDGKNFLLGTIGKITSWFKESFWGPLVGAILKVVSFATIGNVILGALRGFFNGDFSTSLVSAFADSMNWVISNVGGLIPGLGAKFAKAFEPLQAYFNTSAVEMTDSFGGLLDFLKITLPKAFSSFGSVLGEVAGPIALITGLVFSLTSSYGGLGGVMERIGQLFDDVKSRVSQFWEVMKDSGVGKGIDKLKEGFSNLGLAFKKVYDELGKLKPLWELVFKLIGSVATVAIEVVMTALDSLGTMLGGVVDIIAGVLNTIVDLFTGNWQNLNNDAQMFVDGFKSIFEGIVEFITGIFLSLGDGIANILGDAWQYISDRVSEFVNGIVGFFQNLKYQLIGDPIVIDMVNGIIDVFNQFVSDALGVFEGFVDWMVGIFKDIWNKVQEVLTTMKEWLLTTWENIRMTAETVWTYIKDFLAMTWDLIYTKIVEIWTIIHEWLIAKFEMLKALVSLTWENIKSFILTAWETIRTFTMELWNSIHQFLIELWDLLTTLFTDSLENLKQIISDAWNAVKEGTEEIWNNLKQFISDTWDAVNQKSKEITDSVREKWITAYTKITEQWSKFKDFWRGVWDGIADIARRALNSCIDKLNQFSFSIPDWVPLIGGRSFRLSIPHLANGGIIDNPTVAMLGEYAGAKTNPEIAAPQSLLQEIITEGNNELIDVWVQTTRQIIEAIDGVDVSVAIGDEQIAQSANRGNNAYKQRTGKPLFSM